MVTVFTENKPTFPLGKVVATSNALRTVPRCEVMAALGRHMSRDWGDVSPGDWAENDLALREGERLLSSYKSDSGQKFWIITEADRSATTVLLPQDY